MGHITASKHDLVPLIDRINKYPIGLVDNEILRKILTLLFSEEEAYVASKFPLEEATLKELAKATGKNEEELLPILESMADKGLIMDLPYEGTTYYLLLPGLIGFFEFTFMKNRKDLPLKEVAQLMTDYLHWNGKEGQAQEFFGSKTPLTRSLVYDEHIPTESVVTTYENAREIVKNSSYGAAGLCYCRHKKHHLGKSCNKGAPMEGICISLGTGAKFLVRRGFAEEKSREELLEIIDKTHELKLTHITDNIRDKPSFICNCCSCCCEIMEGVKSGFYEGVGKTSYIARVNQNVCNYCGDCFSACNVNAIGLDRSRQYVSKDDRVSRVDEEICLGCGACISSCTDEAIKLELRPEVAVPPRKKKDLFKTILREKGKLSPFIISRAKRKFVRFFRV